VKALTVQQPWCWAIAAGAKTVENRSQSWSHRGLLAIHAGGRWSARGAHDQRVARAYVAALAKATGANVTDDAADLAATKLAVRGLPRLDPAFATGAVVAIATLEDAHPDAGCCRPWGESLYAEGGGRIRTVVHHLVLANIARLERPVPCPGRLGLWDLPPDVEGAAVAALGAPW
jgi:hypothetical protein